MIRHKGPSFLSSILFLFVSVCITHAQQPKLVLQLAHQGQVEIVGFIHDGTALITKDQLEVKSTAVKIWDIETGRLLLTIPATSDPVLSPDKKILANTDIDGTIKLWDLITCQRLRTLKPDSRKLSKVKIGTIVFSPDGRFVASPIQESDVEETIQTWEIASGEKRIFPLKVKGLTWTIVFSPDGRFMASQIENYGDESGTRVDSLQTWEIASGRTRIYPFWEKPEHFKIIVTNDGKVLPVKGLVSPDGRVVAQPVNESSDPKDWFVEIRDAHTNHLLRTIKSAAKYSDTAFSPDSKILVAGAGQATKLWDVATGAELQTISGNHAEYTRPAFSHDGRVLAIVAAVRSNDVDQEMLELFDVASGSLLQTLKGTHENISSIAFSPDDKSVAGSYEFGSTLWDVATGRELRSLTGYRGLAYEVAFSPDGNSLVIPSRNGPSPSCIVWELTSGREPRIFAGEFLYFSPDARTILLKSDLPADRKEGAFRIKVLDVESGAELRTLKSISPCQGNAVPGGWTSHGTLELSPDGKILAIETSCDDSSTNVTMHLRSVETGKLISSINGLATSINFIRFSPNSRTIAVGVGEEKAFGLWDVATGKLIRKLLSGSVESSAQFSPDGTKMASINGKLSDEQFVKVWDSASGKLLYKRELSEVSVKSDIAFSPDGKFLAGSGLDVDLWDVSTGTKLRTFDVDTRIMVGDDATEAVFSPNSKFLISSLVFPGINRIQVWDVAAGVELPFLRDQSEDAEFAKFSPDGRMLVTLGRDDIVKLWDWQSGELFASLVNLSQDEWVVTDPVGRFDSTPGALKFLHFAVGFEPIVLEQLKERYYEPGLLAKLLGFAKEPLRDVSKFENPKLYPEVKYEPPPKGSSTFVVSLTNRGGGIGRVQVFVNDKEFLADARDDKLRRNQNVSQATLNIDLSRAPGMVSGEENKIRVLAWNEENYISSRGDEKPWVAPGPTGKEKPEVYAIVVGISNYAGPKLKLSYAATDAIAMANAIELGANRLFGADKVHMKLLTTANDPRAIEPTKANVNEAFAALQREAKSKDILVVYLAGHAITFQQGGHDTYCYLTREAETTDVSDPEVRKQRTLTSDELVEWIKQIPANKQAIMLDTCAAGAAQEQLIAAARAGSGDAIRAIELAMDRTGSYFLMGSAADAESYETTQYGQGLLTYALLKGIKGDALDDAGVVDVNALFHFAREEVEKLAKNIDKIQKPRISAPKGDTFPVGQLTREDSEKILLATPRPIILRPNFQEAQTFVDTLDLMKSLRELLRNETAMERGTGEAPFGFSNTEDFPGGIKPVGRYEVEGDNVTVELRLQRDNNVVFSTRVMGTKEDIAAKVMEAMRAAIRHL